MKLIDADAVMERIEQAYKDMGVDTHGVWNKQLAEIFKTADVEDIRQCLSQILGAVAQSPTIDRPQGEWVDCKEPPSTDRNVFIAYGTDDMKSVCIGHYEHDMKLWYEDKNFFATPIYDAMYWCEIPQFPTRMKGA